MELITINCHGCEVTIEEKDGILEVVCSKDGEVVDQISCPCGDDDADEVETDDSEDLDNEDLDGEVIEENVSVKTFDQFLSADKSEKIEESEETTEEEEEIKESNEPGTAAK